MSRYGCCTPSDLKSAPRQRQSPSGISDIGSVRPTRRRYTFRVLGRNCPAGRKALSRPLTRCQALALTPSSGFSRLSHGSMAVPRVPSECRLHGRNTLRLRRPCHRLSGAGHTEPDPTARAGSLPLPSAHREDAAHQCAEAHASPTCCASGSQMVWLVACTLLSQGVSLVACRLTRCGLTPASVPRRSPLILDLC